MVAGFSHYVGPLMILGGIISLAGTSASSFSDSMTNPLEMLVATIPIFFLMGLVGLSTYTQTGRVGKAGLGLSSRLGMDANWLPALV